MLSKKIVPFLLAGFLALSTSHAATAGTTSSYLYRIPVPGLAPATLPQAPADPSDPYYAYVGLLMHMDDTSDSTGKNVISPSGTPSVSTSVKEMGTGSMYFNGSSTLSAPNSASVRFGTNDFTVEFWMNVSTAWTNQGSAGVVGQKRDDTTNGWVIYRDTTKPNQMNLRFAGMSFCETNSTPANGTWQHWAVTRQGTTVRWFLNGVLDATCSTGTLLNDNESTGSLYVGYSQTWGGYLKGYIDDLRVTNGVARYSSNFTPPAAPFPNH